MEGDRNMKSLSYKRQKYIIILTFLFLPMLFLLTFTYYPAVKLVQISLSNWNGYSSRINYVGLTNYINAFKDGSVFKYLANNFAYVIMMLMQTVVGFYLAVILDTKIKGRNFFKSLIFMPYIMNGIAIAFMFSYLYSYDEGPINVILRNLGMGQYAIKWLGDSYSINFSLAFIVLWRYLGLDMVIFLGALQSIPKDLYEASSMEGANLWHNIRYITIPSIKTVISLLLFLGINGSLQVFFEPYVLTGGGPAGRSETFSTVAYNYAFKFKQMGKASAMGIILLTFIVLILVARNIVMMMRKKGGADIE